MSQFKRIFFTFEFRNLIFQYLLLRNLLNKKMFKYELYFFKSSKFTGTVLPGFAVTEYSSSFIVTSIGGLLCQKCIQKYISLYFVYVSGKFIAKWAFYSVYQLMWTTDLLICQISLGTQCLQWHFHLKVSRRLRPIKGRNSRPKNGYHFINNSPIQVGQKMQVIWTKMLEIKLLN